MAIQNKSRVLVSFLLMMMGALLLCFISSCGKNGVSASGSNTQLQIVNLSPDIQPVFLYQDLLQQNPNTFTYPNSSGYFFLSTLKPPLQLRTATISPITLLQIDTPLKANSKYTLFITGLRADSSFTKSFLTLDTTKIPPIGKGKVRFVHASYTSPALDLRINDTLAFSNRTFNTVSPYVNLTAGNYNFTITTTKTPGKVEFTLKNITILDGRAYTIYTTGLVGRTDSLVFGAGVLTNNLLVTDKQ